MLTADGIVNIVDLVKVAGAKWVQAQPLLQHIHKHWKHSPPLMCNSGLHKHSPQTSLMLHINGVSLMLQQLLAGTNSEGNFRYCPTIRTHSTRRHGYPISCLNPAEVDITHLCGKRYD